MIDPSAAAPDSTTKRRAGRLGRLSLATLAAGALALSPLTTTAASAATPVTHSIAQVQGAGATTPLNGLTVTVQGIVTGVYPAPSGYNGFYLQTQNSGGGNKARTTSDGIFVFTGSTSFPAIAVGDKATVTGRAGEFQGVTQLTASAPGAVEVIDSGYKLPKTTNLPDTVIGDAREAYEGMLVKPTGTYVLSSTHQLFNFGSLWLSAGGDVVQPTETTDAGAAAAAIAAQNAARRLLVDDGYNIQISNSAHPGGQPYLTEDTVVRTGDTFVAPKRPMILSYGFGDWRLQPQVAINDASKAAYKPTFEPTNPRPESAPEVGGDVQFASFNVFNYFTTFGGDARGASSPEDFAIQKSKIVAAINGLGAEVVALQEIENSVKLGEEKDEALADLVDGLNAAAGEGTWSYVETPDELADGAITDFITNAIIYKTDAVTPVGESFTQIDETVWDNAREPVAQTFEVARGVEVTVVANHFKSKSAPSGGGAEPADGQGFFNEDRVAQAQAVKALVDDIVADEAKGPNVLLLGDFNAYAEEDPIQVLTGAGMVDLLPELTDDQYTYTFNGQLGSLDHAIATPELAAAITGIGVWEINSAEWSDRGFEFDAAEPGTPYRSSDHDPIVLGMTAVDGPAEPVEIDLVSINDFHGRLEAAPPVAGAAVLGGMVDSYEAANPNTLFVGVGDLIGASTFTSFIQDDQPTIDALNEIGLDVSALGNHEFDKGRADLDDRILDEADWPYLAANVYEKGTTTPAYQEYSLHELEGVTVGFVGAVTEDLPTLVSPDGLATLDVGEVVPAVNRVADQLSDGNTANGEADVVIALVHEGAASTDIADATDDSNFGRIVTGLNANIDAIYSGHTHLAYDHDIAIPGTDRTRPVVSSGQYGEKYAHTSLSVDPETKQLLSLEVEVLPLTGFAPDPEVAQIVADAVAKANELGAVSLGQITGDFNRAKQSAASFSENRGGESTIGNLIADVQLEATADLGTEVALMNPGGIRADLKYASSGPGDPDGNVTYREAATVQPFANTLVTVTLTGAELEAVLEQQWQPTGAARPFLKLGVSRGFEYTYDPDAAAGERITAMWLNDELVTDEQSIKVVTNSFLASGGDNFGAFSEGEGLADSGRIDLEAFVDYFERNSPVSPDLAQRSVGVKLSAPASGEAYTAGEQVTLTLSSLLFSNAGAQTGEATVSLGETVLGSAPIGFTIVDARDEQGTASVTVTIPEGVSGPQVLTVEGPGGTSIGVPITVAEVDVPEEPTEPVGTSIDARASKLITFNGKVNYRVQVTADDDSAPVGTITVRDGSKVVAEVELTADDGGEALVQLSKLKRGLHLLTATFEGEGFEQSVGGLAVVLSL